MSALKKRFVFSNDNKNINGVKRGLMKELGSMDLTKPKEVIIQDYKENKTDEQRSWFHSLCGLFGGEVGCTKLQMKRVMLREVFGVEVVLGVEIGRSSESLKRDDYSTLIEQTYIKAGEMGFQLPPPMRMG